MGITRQHLRVCVHVITACVIRLMTVMQLNKPQASSDKETGEKNRCIKRPFQRGKVQMENI